MEYYSPLTELRHFSRGCACAAQECGLRVRARVVRTTHICRVRTQTIEGTGRLAPPQAAAARLDSEPTPPMALRRLDSEPTVRRRRA